MKSAGIAAAGLTVTTIGFRSEVAAGAGAIFVDAADGVFTHGATEGNAASGLFAGARHMGAAGENPMALGQGDRYPTAGFRIEFLL